MTGGKWHALSAAVAADGRVTTYMDGVACAEASPAPATQIQLGAFGADDRLQLFCGGQQTETRGGCLRRVQLHAAGAPSPDEVRASATLAWGAVPLHARALVKLQALARGRAIHKLAAANELE